MPARPQIWLVVGLVTALLCSCEDSGNCPCSPDRIDPTIPDLSVTWKEGSIGADLMPIHPPDPIGCRAWLILENRNPREALPKIEIPSAFVILAENDSTLGTIRFETDWDGLLAPGEQDTVLFSKKMEAEEIFGPPCNKRVLLDFLIRSADGDAMFFRSDPFGFHCVY